MASRFLETTQEVAEEKPKSRFLTSNVSEKKDPTDVSLLSDRGETIGYARSTPSIEVDHAIRKDVYGEPEESAFSITADIVKSAIGETFRQTQPFNYFMPERTPEENQLKLEQDAESARFRSSHPYLSATEKTLEKATEVVSFPLQKLGKGIRFALTPLRKSSGLIAKSLGADEKTVFAVEETIGYMSEMLAYVMISRQIPKASRAVSKQARQQAKAILETPARLKTNKMYNFMRKQQVDKIMQTAGVSRPTAEKYADAVSGGKYGREMSRVVHELTADEMVRMKITPQNINTKVIKKLNKRVAEQVSKNADRIAKTIQARIENTPTEPIGKTLPAKPIAIPVEKASEGKPLEERLSGDALLDAQDLKDELSGVGAEIDKNSVVTLYHRTTKEAAEEIRRTKNMTSKEADVFFSTKKEGQAEGFGDEIIKIQVPIEKIKLDDIFEDEAHVAIPLVGKKLDISKFLAEQAQAKQEAPSLEQEALKFESAEEFVKAQRTNKIIDGKLGGEIIAQANPDGTITVDKDNFYGHSKADQLDILEHEYAHFIEEHITPEFKAELFDDKQVMSYRGKNINEKLANMIQDGKLPKKITDKFPNLPKTKAQLTEIYNKAHAGKADVPEQDTGFVYGDSSYVDDEPFDFGENVPVEATPAKRLTVKEQIDLELEGIDDKEDQIMNLKFQLEEIKKVADFLKRSIKETKLDAQTIPSQFITKKPEGMDLENALEAINDSDLGLVFPTINEMVDYLIDIPVRRKAIKNEIDNLRASKVVTEEFREKTLKARLKDIDRGVKEGKTKSKNVIKDKQKQIKEIIKTSEMDSKTKSMLTTAVNAVQNNAELEDVILKIEKNFNKIGDKVAVEKAKAISQAVRKSIIAERKNIKANQEELLAIVKLAGFEKNFISAIKNVQTDVQLEKAIPTVMERIAQMEERIAKKKIIDNLKKEVTPARVRRLRPEFRDKVQPVLDKIDFSKPSTAKLLELMSLSDYINREPDNNVPERVLRNLDRLSKVPLSDLKIEEVQEIADVIKTYVRLNELKNKLIIKGKLREFTAIRNQAIKNVSIRNKNIPDTVTGLDSSQKEVEASLVKAIFGVDAWNAELNTQVLDGADNDIIQEIIYREMDRGVDREFEFHHNAEDFFRKRIPEGTIDGWSHVFNAKAKDVETVSIKISENRTIKMSKGERVAFILHSRNPQNRKHLEKGGFSFVNTTARINKITKEDVDSIVNSATKAEVNVADVISEYFNTIQKDAINKVSVNLMGFEVAVEPEYFPIRTNALDRFKDNLIKAGNFVQITLEGMGMLKERQSASNAIILDDAFVSLYKSVTQAGAYVGLAGPLRGAKALLEDPEFQKTMITSGEKARLKMLKNYISRIEGDAINLDNVERLTQELINKLDTAVLGLNPFVMLKQPISFLGAASEIDIKYLVRAANKVTDKTVSEMKKYAPQLRDRFEGNVTREMGEVAQVGRVKKFFTGKEVINSKIMKGIGKFDELAISRIWEAAKLEVRENNLDLTGDEFYQKVAERAWKITRRTQPTFHVKDRSTIGMSKNLAIRLATKYSSQRNKNWMIIGRAVEKYNRSNKLPKDKADLAGVLTIVAIISPLMLLLVDEFRGFVYNKKQKKTIFQRAMHRLITGNLGNIYFLGDAVESLMSKIDNGTYAGYDINNILVSTFDQIIDTAANVVRGVKQAVTQENYTSGDLKGQRKWKTTIPNTIRGIMDLTGKSQGVPISGPRKLVEGIVSRFKKPKPKKSLKIGG